MKRAILVSFLLGAVGACAGPAAQRAHTPQAANQSLTAAQLLEVAAVLEQSGDSVRAEQYLHAALEQGADADRVVPRLLRLYVADGQYRLAIEQAEQRLRRQPHALRLRLFVAALHAAVGADTLAARHYERVLQAEPRNAEAHYALASLLHQAGREPARADEHFRAYLTLQPRGDYAAEARSLLLTEMP